MIEPIMTKRLILRPFEAADWTAVLTYMSDPEVMRYLPWQPFGEAEARAFVLDSPETDEFPEKLAVILKSTGDLIGHVVFERFNEKYRTRELGYVLHPAHQGQGYASEASRALLGHGFRALGLHRVIATCDPRNTASFGVMEKLGMRREGRFKKDVQLDGEWTDEYFYAILEEEWEARQRVVV